MLLREPNSRRLIELDWYPKGSIFYTPYTPGDAVDHLDLSLGVVPRETLDRVHRKLLKSGAKPTRWTPATMEGWSTHVLDPNGIWITVGRRPTRKERGASK